MIHNQLATTTREAVRLKVSRVYQRKDEKRIDWFGAKWLVHETMNITQSRKGIKGRTRMSKIGTHTSN